MRPTGLSFKSPKDKSGEFTYPIRSKEGRCLDMAYKSISEQRRELLYYYKLTNNQQKDQPMTLQDEFEIN